MKDSLKAVTLIPLDLPPSGRVYVGIACVTVKGDPGDAFRTANELAKAGGTVVSLIPPRLPGSIVELVAAALAVYSTVKRGGRTISKNPGLELAAYLLAQRNVSRAVKTVNEGVEREGKALAVAVDEDGERVRDLLETLTRILGGDECPLPPPKPVEPGEKARATLVALFAALKKL